jgi:hypothetical protein
MRVSLGVVACAVMACGSNAPTDQNGVQQISAFSVNPTSVVCGNANTVPHSENASPDTVAILVELVNTTHNDMTVMTSAVIGIVVGSSTASDVGTMSINYSSLPFHPNPALVRAVDGDVKTTTSLPMGPLCQIKTTGFQDIEVSTRIQTTTGEFDTAPTTIHVSWQ